MELKAVVQGGRLILDQATTLPEGTVLDLVVEDGGDELSPDDRAALEASIARGLEQTERGEGEPANDVLQRLRNLRR